MLGKRTHRSKSEERHPQPDNKRAKYSDELHSNTDPDNLREIKADLLEFRLAECIAQQSNCVTRKGSGLYKSIVDKYPSVDIYKMRDHHSIPGSALQMKIDGSEKEDPNPKYVMHMFAQYYPGKCIIPADDAESRIEWFKDCLADIASQNMIKSIAFPKNIGCGLAGGDWNIYRRCLKDFAQKNPHIQVYIVDNSRPKRKETLNAC